MEENLNSQTPPVATPPILPTVNATTPPPGSKSKGRKSLTAIIGTILFLLIAGGAAAGFVYKDKLLSLVSKPTSTPAVAVSPTAKPDPTANPDSIGSDWKTYEGDGFSFKYPSRWIVVEEENRIYLYPAGITSQDIQKNSDEYLVDYVFPPMINIGIYNRPFSDEPKGNIIENGIEHVTEWQEITVDGITGHQFQPHQCAPKCAFTVQFPYNNGAKTLSFQVGSAAQEEIQQWNSKFHTSINNVTRTDLDQILSTFKFVE